MAVFPPGDPRNDEYPYMRDYTAFLKKMERPLVGRQKEMAQLMAAMARPELCNAILLAEAGSGKACDVDTPLPVADGRGYIRLGDVKPGDMVFNEEGEPVEVLKVFPQGEIPAYRVTFVDGSEIVCNEQHLWATRSAMDAWDGKPYAERTLQAIMAEGLFEGPLCRHLTPPAKPIRREPVADLPMDPYLAGLLILYYGNQLEFGIEAKADARLQAVAGVDAARLFDIWRNGFIDSLSPVMGKVYAFPPSARRLPEAFFHGSVEQRQDLLMGMMDCVGRVGNTIEMGTVVPKVWIEVHNEGMAQDIRTLAASLGYRTLIRHDGTRWTLDFLVSWDEAEGLFTMPEVKGLYHFYQHGDPEPGPRAEGLAIVGIEDLHERREMLCIYVAGESHLFQIGYDHIVTHNTALVQGTMVKDTGRAYLEVDLPKMIAGLKNENEMADKLKQLFKEVEAFRKSTGKEIVLFIDEFHQIVQLSPAAVEVLKPLLADSGTRGIRVIAATTYIEFQEYVASNLPLVERLQRINLNAPDEDTVVSILRGMAERYGVKSQFPTDAMFHSIYEYTNRYIPATAQPRKSILMLDSMIGWHRFTKKPMDMKMLADVIYDTEGVNIAFRVNAKQIKEELDKAVLSQEFATSAIEGRLQICVADLNNKNRPMSSFLFTGSTGVGKQVFDDVPVPVYTKDGSVHVKRNGDLEVGDFVFNQKGEPVRILGVYPQGVHHIYEVELTDGRVLQVGKGHLWTYKSRFGNGSKAWKVADTETLMAKYENKYHNKGRTAHNIKFVIPMNQAVQWPEMEYAVDPYVMGAFLGNGCLREQLLSFSSDDEFVVEKVAKLLGSSGYVPVKSSYTWHFQVPDDLDLVERNARDLDKSSNHLKYFPTDYVFAETPELVGLHSPDRFIPDIYKHGSVEQRWALVQGLFDTNGHICGTDGGRYNVSYSSGSKRLVEDLQDVLYSLGISSSISDHGTRKDREWSKSHEYDLHVKIGNPDKHRFFSLPRKLAIAEEAKHADDGKSRVKKFGEVIGIRDIRRTGETGSMTCIMVDDPDHLYQAGQYVVSHNTETTKQLARILFQDDRSLVRFDMSEYALEESLERFRQELTQAVWTRPYCILLLDEIEKSCGPVTRVLLQVLDDGRLLDRHNREVTFKNCYIIVTTNAGSEIYKTIAQYAVDDTGSGKLMEKYESLIRDSIRGQSGGKFPPELLGRIDCLVPFQPLSEKTMGGICEMKLKKLAKEVYDKHHITVQFDKKLVRYIVQDKMTTDSDAGGARGVVSRIEREVTIELSRFINEHPDFRAGRTIYVCVEGALAVDNKFQLETNGRVVVKDTPPGGDKNAVMN